jgi:hypothetical protein
LGKFNAIAGQNCSACPAGQYQDSKGETACKECAIDTYLSETGKSSKADCTPCEPDRSTGFNNGSQTEASCRCKRSTPEELDGTSDGYYQRDDDEKKCTPCPKGGNCTCKDGIKMNEITPQIGYWRSTPNNSIFSNCEQAYWSTDAHTKATERCSNPSEPTLNETFLQWLNCQKTHSTAANSVTFENPDAQCKKGYRGNLCASCASDYVKQGEDCIACPGGGSVHSAMGVLCLLCLAIFIVMVIVLYRVKSSKVAKVGKYLAQVKIIVMFLQIVSSMPHSLGSVRWPKAFKLMAMYLGVINLDMIELFSFDKSSCHLSLHPLHRLVVHVSFVPMLVGTVLAAYAVSILMYKITSKHVSKEESTFILSKKKGNAFKILTTMILLLYPGLGTRIFGMFRCSEIVGLNDKEWFQHDLSMECFKGEHGAYYPFAISCIVLIVIGIPGTVACLLYSNRKALHDVKHEKHLSVKFRLGGLYVPYEPQFWMFEILVMIVK